MSASKILESLVGRHVIVWSRGGSADSRDEGQIVDADGTVVVVIAGADTLVFPLANVRLIKVLD